MYETFSDRARHAMALANREAGRLQHDFLAPAHLMLGLIAEGKCVATETLRLLDVDLDDVRERVQSQLPKGNGQASVGRRAQSKELREVVHLAIQEARNLNHRYVGTEHLILGLIAHGENIPSRVLRERGIDLERLREQALLLLDAAHHPEHDVAHRRHGHLEWVHHEELAKAFRSPKFWRTMILAVDTANRMGASELEPEHLLLALLRDENGAAVKLLNDKGVTADWLREQLAAPV